MIVLPPTPPVEATALDRALQRLSNYSRFLELFYYRIDYLEAHPDEIHRKIPALPAAP